MRRSGLSLRSLSGLALVLFVACKATPGSGGGAGGGPPSSPPGASASYAPVPPSTAVTPASPAEVGTGDDPCGTICGRTRALGCRRAADCVSGCREMRKVTACVGEMAMVLGCMSREPIAHWVCNEEGEAEIKDGFCDAEQGKFVACVQKTAGAPSGPAPTAL